MITNRYPGKCNSCTDPVASGKGFAYKQGQRWFTVCPSKACLRRLGLKDPEIEVIDQKRFINEKGEIYMPFDRDALPLLRAMPGARWNPGQKCWTVSTKTADLARVLEIANQLKIEVPTSFRERAAEGTEESRDAKRRAQTQGLYEYQREGVEFLALHDRAFLADGMGLGKQQAVDTLVATPDGWERIGNLSKGDFVIGSNGGPTVVTGVFPQGKKPSYRLYFSDGSSVEAGPDHLWTVAYHAGGRRWHEITVTTEELRTGAKISQSWSNGRTTQTNLSKTRLYLPMLSNPINWKSDKLPLPAYLVGQLIANADTATGTPRLSVNTKDWPEVKNNLTGIKMAARQYGSVVQVNISGILPAVRSLAMNVRSRHKRIPKQYLIASVPDRKSLLQGLMDADGSCSKKGNKLTYHTISIGLAQDVLLLVESLGGIASIREYDRSHEGKPIEYQVRIRVPSWIEPFSISRKKSRYNPGSHAGPCRVFVKAEYVRNVESVCIAVDADDKLYVTEHCILTHNTVQALVALPKEAKAIIVCPASLKYNWKDEIDKWRPDLNVYICKGRNSFVIPSSGDVTIINYDILPSKYTKEIPETDKNLLKEITLICDEAHLCKNYKTARSKKVSNLSRVCQKVWFLSGTPLMNRPPDLFGVMCSGDMNVFGRWNKFVSLFNGFPNGWGGYEWGTPTPEVPERLKRVMLRRLKKDVLKDLPKKTHKIVTVAIDGKLKRSLDSMWERTNWDEAHQIGGLPSFEEFSAIRAKLAKARIPAAIEIVESYEESETPLIVFSAHKEPVKEIGSRDGWAYITGDTSSLERNNIVASFQAGALKGVALTIIAGGVGLTLTRASHALFIDLDWTPSNNLQAEDRIHRIGAQGNKVQYLILRSNHDLDHHVHNLIVSKMQMIEAALERRLEYQTPDKKNVAELVDESDKALAERLRLIEEAAKDAEKEFFRDKVHRILERERGKAQIPEPELTDRRKDLLEDALSFMLGRCDGALEKDGVGFNKPDAAIAHWIGQTGMDREDETTYRVLERILSRYSRQLSLTHPGIWCPNSI